MRAGLLVKNEAGTVLISDAIETLQFIGKATYDGNDGGAYNNFPKYEGAYDYHLDGRVIYDYHFYTQSDNAIPIVFIRPKMYDRYHALITQSQDSSNPKLWYLKVMVGLENFIISPAPKLYCFVNSDDDLAVGNNDYGLQIFKQDGVTKTFDSNAKPLAIIDGFFMTPPTNPMNSGIPTTSSGYAWRDKTLDWDFGTGNPNNYNAATLTNSEPYTDLMFSASSFAQCCYKRQKNGYKNSSGQKHWSTAMWWAMNRNSFRFTQTQIRSGWTIFAAGYWYTESYEDGGWFGGDSGGYTEGVMPYNPKTINLNTSSMVMIADVKRFDPNHHQTTLTYQGPYYDLVNDNYYWRKGPSNGDLDNNLDTNQYFNEISLKWAGVEVHAEPWVDGLTSITIGNTTYYRGRLKYTYIPYRGPRSYYYEILRVKEE